MTNLPERAPHSARPESGSPAGNRGAYGERHILKQTGAPRAGQKPPRAPEPENTLPALRSSGAQLTDNPSEAAIRRLEFLVEVGDLLNSSLSYNRTLKHLADLMVPRFADWCVIDIAGPDGALNRLTVAHTEPEKRKMAAALRAKYPPDTEGDRGAFAVYRTGKPIRVESIPDEWLRQAALDDEHLSLLRELGLRSYLSVPLAARGAVVGVLSLVMAESSRAYTDEDLTFAMAVASRAAVAVDNARLFTEARREQVRRRRATEQLENNLERLNFTLNAADVGIWEWNLHTDEVTWSDQVERIHGRIPGTFRGTAQSALEDVHPNDRQRIRSAIAKAVETGDLYEVEYRVIRDIDQRVAWLYARAEAVRGRDGSPRIFRGVCMDITDRKRSEEDTSRLAAIVASSCEGIVSTTLDGFITSWNIGAERLFGYTAEEAVGQHISLTLPEGYGQEMEMILASVAKGRGIEQLETVRRRKDGKLVDILISVSPVRDAQGRVIGAASIKRDISGRKRTETALRESEERFRRIAENALDLIFMTDHDGYFVYANPSFETVLGYEPEQLRGRHFTQIVHPGDRSNLASHWPNETLTDFRGLREDGEFVWMEGRTYPVSSEKGAYVVGILRDISSRKMHEYRLQHEASHDALTGLPNRASFFDRLQHAMDRGQRGEPEYAVLLLDLDDFKTVNDSLGHLAGDALLAEFSDRVRLCLRPTDTLARLGGDEFVLLLEEEHGEEGVRAVAERITEAVAAPFRLEGKAVRVGVSIGAALGQPEFRSPPDALRRADAALYKAKGAGKGGYVLAGPG